MADGHEKANSDVITIKATNISSVGNQFIIGSSDWTNVDSNGSQRIAQWSKTDGTGVCPVGFRVPTLTELRAENITNSTDAFSKLKFPLAGDRYGTANLLSHQGLYSHIWTTSMDDSRTYNVYFSNDTFNWIVDSKDNGFSVRCIDNSIVKNYTIDSPPKSFTEQLALKETHNYTFTLSKKSKVTIDAITSSSLNSAGWLLDSAGNKITTIADWNSGVNNQFKIEKLLEAGTYKFTIFAENNTSGKYNLKFKSEEIDASGNIIIPLSIGSLSQYNLVKNSPYSLPIIINSPTEDSTITLSASGLPDGMSIVKKDSSFNIVGTPKTNGSFSVILTASQNGLVPINKTIQMNIEELTVHKITNPIIKVNQTDDTTYANTAGYKVTQPLSFKVAFNQPNKIQSLQFYFLDKNGTKVSADTNAISSYDGWEIDLGEYGTGLALFGDQPKSTDTRSRVKAVSFKVITTDNRVVELRDAIPLNINYVGLTDGNWISWNSMNDATPSKVGNLLSTIGKFWKEPTDNQKYDDYVNSVVDKQGKGCFEINERRFCDWDYEINNSTNTLTNDTSKVAVKTGDIVKIYGGSYIFLKLGKHEYLIDSSGKGDTVFELDTNDVPNFAKGYLGKETQIFLKPLSVIYDFETMQDNRDIELYSDDVITAVRGTTASIYKDANGVLSFKTYEGVIDVTSNGQTKTVSTGTKLDNPNGTVQAIDFKDINFKEAVYLNTTSDYVLNPTDRLGSLNITTNNENATYMIIGRNVIIGGGIAFNQEELAAGNYTIKFMAIPGMVTPNEVQFTISSTNPDININVNYSDIPPTLSPKEQFIERFYQNIMGRTADSGGMTTWLNTIQNESATKVALGFFKSQEFINKNLSNEQFVDILYSTLFDRVADNGGKSDWLNKLQNGTTKNEVMYGFFNAQEFKNLADRFGVTQIRPEDQLFKTSGVDGYVNRFYTLVLNRTPDENGYNDWVGQLNSGTRAGGDIAKGFFNSQEYSNRGLDNSTFLDICYRAFFDREADSGGKSDWLNRITTQGYTKDQILDGFIDSQEFINLANKFGIKNRL